MTNKKLDFSLFCKQVFETDDLEISEGDIVIGPARSVCIEDAERLSEINSRIIDSQLKEKTHQRRYYVARQKIELARDVEQMRSALAEFAEAIEILFYDMAEKSELQVELLEFVKELVFPDD